MWQEYIICQHFLFIGLLLQGEILHIALPAISTNQCTGESTLQPLSYHSCPNESVTFTCSGSQLTVMTWEVKPYTNRYAPLSYVPSQLSNDFGSLTMNSSNRIFLSELIYISRINENFANMTTSLTVRNAGVRNGTNVTCTTLGFERCDLSAIIYFTGIKWQIID